MFNPPKPIPSGNKYYCVSDSKSRLLVKFEIATDHGLLATTTATGTTATGTTATGTTATGTTAEEEEEEEEKGYEEERCWC